MKTPRGARRTDALLSDGRALIYYDPADAPARVPLDDTRGLPAPHPQVELRTDPLTGDVITYATHRNTRTYLPPADQCPLCASKPGNPTEIPDHDYNVAVFENRFPSFAGPGRTEVVCFTATTTSRSRTCPRARPGWWSTPGPTGPPSWAPATTSNSSSRSRTAAVRSA